MFLMEVKEAFDPVSKSSVQKIINVKESDKDFVQWTRFFMSESCISLDVDIH